jgi:hypothetical protein
MECYTGYLDSILTIFSNHNHPFILLNDFAMKWMGCANLPNGSVDVLVRSSRHDSILKDLLTLSDWEITQSQHRGIFEIFSEGETILKNTRDSSMWPYLRLFPEELFFLSIDGPIIEVPDLWAWNTTLVEIEFHPDRKNFLYGPKNYTAYCAASLPPPKWQSRSLKCKIPIYVPTITTFINAMWDHVREYADVKNEMLESARYNIRNFIRYLFLDRPHQRELILSKMYDENREVMKDRIDGYKRKITISINPRTREIGPYKPWEAAYPNGQEF